MNPSSPAASIRGIIPPMVTPLAGIDELDISGLERLIEHILQGGVHGIFILGTTGEGPALSDRLRRELIERTCRQVANRVPVLVGLIDSAYPEMLHVADWAAQCGASALVVAPPFYFPLSQADLLRMIESLSKDLALPFYLYNQPELTKVSFSPETVAVASEIHGVIGIKDSSGDIGYVREILRRRHTRSPFHVLVGPEHLLEEALACGADGGVPGGANIFPELPVQLYEAHRRGDSARAHEIQRRIITLGAPIWNVDEEGTGHLRRLKCALSLLGLCSGRPAWPSVESAPEERTRMEEHLTRHGILASSGPGEGWR
jgi:dihydrodipicolinate synthase/N-acetylneuraminate lyase